MKVDKYTVTDIELKKEYAKWNFGESPDDTEWRRQHTACQLLKVMEGYRVSYSQRDVLRSLGLVNLGGKAVNAKGRRFIFDAYYKQKYS